MGPVGSEASFDAVLQNWASTSNSPRPHDAGLGYDGSVFENSDWGLTGSLLDNTSISRLDMQNVLASYGGTAYGEHVPPLPQWLTGDERNGNFSSEHLLPSPDNTSQSTLPSSATDKSAKVNEIKPGERPSSLSKPALALARSVFVNLSQQLSDLSKNLVEHSASIPPHSIHDSPHICLDRAVPDISSDDDSTSDAESTACVRCYGTVVFSIENTFHLTEALLDLYPEFIKETIRLEAGVRWRGVLHHRNSPSPVERPEKALELQNGAHSKADDSFSAKPDSLPQGSNDAPTSVSRGCAASMPPLDVSSIFLLISCHHRVISIWETIVGHLRFSTHKPVKSQALKLDSHCAQVRIGSYVPPSKAASSMYLAFIKELAERSVAKAQELAEEVEAVAGGKRSDALMDATAITCRVLKERANGLVELLRQTTRDVVLRAWSS